MKHDWYDPRPNIPAMLLEPERRRCRHCGKEQTFEVEYLWMRRVSARWYPLAGRCPGKSLQK